MDCYKIRKKQLEEQIQELKKELATLEQRDLYEKVYITADQAKELTEKVLVEHTEFSKKHIMKLIKESTEIGLTSVEIPYLLSTEIKMWLINLGYSIDSDLKTIHWD